MLIEKLLDFFQNEATLFGGTNSAYTINLLCILFTLLFYFLYYLVIKLIRKKEIIRNPEIEKLAYTKKIITDDQLMTKYSANLGASSTMAALSVTMVLLSVAALFEKKLSPYNNFIAIIVCTLMTIASAALLFAHELYDAIINPIFNPERKFILRKLGSDFQVLGLVMFIISMLLAISTVSTIATIVSSVACCLVMILYIEKRLVDKDKKEKELSEIIDFHQKRNNHG
ncbi:MAG: hypothetical protein KKD47_03240 [Proteobacteria bacterium]|nr:hypothetical protein [Pseudomonadota bacterium]